MKKILWQNPMNIEEVKRNLSAHLVVNDNQISHQPVYLNATLHGLLCRSRQRIYLILSPDIQYDLNKCSFHVKSTDNMHENKNIRFI